MKYRTVAILSLFCALLLACSSVLVNAEETKKVRFEEIRLTDNPVIDSDPFFSPDMKMVVYCSVSNKKGRTTLHTMDSDGKKRKSILDVKGECHSAPSILPSGKQILFAWSRDNAKGISLVNLEGKERKDFSVPAGDLNSPVVSPDGKKVCYTIYGDKQYLYVLDIEKNKYRKLVETQNSCDMPVFNKDGSIVYYVEYNDNGTNVCRINIDGTNRRVLTSTGPGEGMDNTYPQVTDDGKLYYISDVKTGEYQLYVCDGDGKNKKLVFEPQSTFTRYAINRQGTKVVLFSNVGYRKWEFFLYDMKTKKTEQITDNQFREKQPSFTSDGKWIYYVCDVMGNAEIFKIKVDK